MAFSFYSEAMGIFLMGKLANARNVARSGYLKEPDGWDFPFLSKWFF